jgi:hypothetical protein
MVRLKGIFWRGLVPHNLSHYTCWAISAPPNILYLENKKFWEELIAYFPWYDTDHIENESNNSSIVAYVFVTAVTFLPSRCLATIGGYVDTYTHTQAATSSYKPTFVFFKISKVG